MVMRYLIDTSIWIPYLKGRNDPLRDRLRGTPRTDLAGCSIVWAELLHGATKYDLPVKRVALIEETLSGLVCLNFDLEAAHEYARIRDHLERERKIIGGNDLMIAAIALAHDLTVITHNSGEFSRVHGLKVEDWAE
jgi:tRNA(fMet)-specific endonuclease VapC